MRDAHRPMTITSDCDYAGVDAATQAAADECIRKEQEMAKEMAIILQRHYPGYPWEVKVEAERAAGMVRLPIMPKNVYFILPFRVMDGMNAMENSVKFAGGELLERFDLSRNGIDFADYESKRPRPMLVANDNIKAGAPKPKIILPN